MTAETAAQEELLRAVLEEQKNAAAAVRNLALLTTLLPSLRSARPDRAAVLRENAYFWCFFACLGSYAVKLLVDLARVTVSAAR
jgi:hypothetical protein